MPRYNHAFTIAVEVVSDHPHGEDVTPDMLRAAIEKRMDSLGDLEIMEAFGSPFDTHEEGR
jgi:hypothetical protein